MARKKRRPDDDLVIPHEEFDGTQAQVPLTKFAAALARGHDPERPLSSAIRQAIAETGLNSVEIAERTGLTKQAVFRFVTGERGATLGTLDRICRALDLEVRIHPIRQATG